MDKRKITQVEFNEAVKKHYEYLQGSSKGARAFFSSFDFSGVSFKEGTNLSYAHFLNCDLSGKVMSDCIFLGAVFDSSNLNNSKLVNSELSDADFNGSLLLGAKLDNACLKNANFSGATYELDSLDEKQREEIIFSDKQKKSEEKLEETSEEREKALINAFEGNTKVYKGEERFWLFLSTIFVLIPIILYSFQAILGMMNIIIKNSPIELVESDGTKSTFSLIKISELTKNNLRGYDEIYGDLLLILPSILILFSLIYFSVFNYNKAKRLRIDYQNKLALLKMYFAVNLNMEKELPHFTPKIADALTDLPTDVKAAKSTGLPLDELQKLTSAMANLKKSSE